MRNRMIVSASGVALALLTATGCSAGGGDDQAAVAWVDKVCGAMKSVQTAGSTQPDVDPDDPASAVKGLDAYFGKVVTAVTAARSTLDTAGPAPVANTGADIDRIRTQLGEVATAFGVARSKVAGIDAADPTALATGLTEALAPVQALEVTADPIGDLRRNPAFDTVARQVPSCSA